MKIYIPELKLIILLKVKNLNKWIFGDKWAKIKTRVIFWPPFFESNTTQNMSSKLVEIEISK